MSEKRQLINANTKLNQILQLSGKSRLHKTALTSNYKLYWNDFFSLKKAKIFTKKWELYKKEINDNYKTENYNNQIKVKDLKGSEFFYTSSEVVKLQ